jgi:hypothetical protein
MISAIPLPIWEAAGIGLVGGWVPDGLRLLNARHDGLPSYLRTWFFWISLAVLGLLGGVVSVLSHPSSVQVAFALGYSAPSIVSALGAKGEPLRKGFAADRTVRRSLVADVRRWWSR